MWNNFLICKVAFPGYAENSLYQLINFESLFRVVIPDVAKAQTLFMWNTTRP